MKENIFTIASRMQKEEITPEQAKEELLVLFRVVQAKPELCSCGRKKNRYWQFCKRCHYTHEFHRRKFGAE
jgi:hypothetical protein